MENYFLDGTKIESKAGRYTFVWKGAVDTIGKKMDKKIIEYLKEAERIADEEYDSEKDKLICAEGKRLKYNNTRKYKSDAGYLSTRRIYKCDSCDKCKVKQECPKSEYRSAAFSSKLWRHKKGAKERLSTKIGIYLRKKRCFEVETVLGQIKGNLGFRRFKSTEFDGISTEWGLLMMRYNMKNLFRLGA